MVGIEWVAAYAEKYEHLCLLGDACNENLGRNQDGSLLYPKWDIGRRNMKAGAGWLILLHPWLASPVADSETVGYMWTVHSGDNNKTKEVKEAVSHL